MVWLHHHVSLNARFDLREFSSRSDNKDQCGNIHLLGLLPGKVREYSQVQYEPAAVEYNACSSSESINSSKKN